MHQDREASRPPLALASAAPSKAGLSCEELLGLAANPPIRAANPPRQYRSSSSPYGHALSAQMEEAAVVRPTSWPPQEMRAGASRVAGAALRVPGPSHQLDTHGRPVRRPRGARLHAPVLRPWPRGRLDPLDHEGDQAELSSRSRSAVAHAVLHLGLIGAVRRWRRGGAEPSARDHPTGGELRRRRLWLNAEQAPRSAPSRPTEADRVDAEDRTSSA